MGKKKKEVYLVLDNMRQYTAIYNSLPSTVWYNLVTSEMDIKKGSARLIYTMVYSKIGG